VLISLTTATIAYSGFPVAVIVPAKFIQETNDFFALISAITPGRNAVCTYSSVVTPAPQGVGMDVKDPRHFPDGQHVTYVLGICHILSVFLFC
jgi:hypothetical protein